MIRPLFEHYAKRGTLSSLRSLRRAVSAELSDLSAELGSVRPLLDKLLNSTPDAIEIRAVATTLHAFYNGVERTFVLIAKRFQEPVGQSYAWHRDLLVQMSAPNRGPPGSDLSRAPDGTQRVSGVSSPFPTCLSDDAQMGTNPTPGECA